jgi:ABC-type sugar transport system ATPase subunit
MVPIALDNVCKRFGEVVALDNLSLSVKAGERIAVLGPSGSGKTTMLRLIAGLDAPTSGAVDVNGVVAMVFQNLALFPHLSAFDNMALGLRARKVAKAEIEQRIAETAALLVIGSLLKRKPHQLSAGERQRVALGRALVKRPSVLLLDEPFANLDAHLRAQLRAELKALHARFGMTMLCVTHDLLEAIALGERIAVLNRGVIEQFDTAERLLDRPASAFVKAFFAFPEIPEMARQLLQRK